MTDKPTGEPRKADGPLSQITKAQKRPPIITILGDAGTGKTSFAASFPKPIVLRIEDGVHRISKQVEQPDVFPVASKPQQVWDQLMAILNDEHDYGTLVIDSVSQLEEMFIQEVLDKDGKGRAIQNCQGGYGAGFAAVAAQHSRVRKAAGLINERRQMAVVFVGHADLETMKLPDKDDFMRYSIRLGKKSLPHYIDESDMVALVRLSSALTGGDDERKKIISDGSREIVCHATAASVTKNGYGITEPLVFKEGENPLAEFMGITTNNKEEK